MKPLPLILALAPALGAQVPTGSFVSDDLSAGDLFLHKHHRASTYRVVEWIGRWGMLDVLLVALLVAAVKLGSWVEVHPGPGVAAFGGVVIFSLLASAAFDPQAIWEEHEPPTPTSPHDHNQSADGGRDQGR